MLINIKCTRCNTHIATIEKATVSDEDKSMYAQISFCNTVNGTTTDDYGNETFIYDGTDTIEVSVEDK